MTVSRVQTSGLGISLVSSFYLSWIFSPRHLPLAWGYHWSVLSICPGFSPPDTYIVPLTWRYHWSVLHICPGFFYPRHLPLAWGYHWSVLYICPGFSPPDTYPWPGDITGQFFLSVLDFLPQTPTPGLEISLVSSLFLSWIFSPRHLPLAWGYHWSVLYICPGFPPPRHLPLAWGYHWSVFYICPGFSPPDTYIVPLTWRYHWSVFSICPGFSPPDTYPWPWDITGQFFLSVLDFLPQTHTPGLEISLVSSLFLSWIFSPRYLPLVWGYHWSVLYICPGFSPEDTYPWPGDITGQFFLSVLVFLPQTPTPGLGISLVSSFYLSWIFSPDTYPWPGDITVQFFISVLDFLPQTPTPDLGVSLISSFYLSWIFSPRHIPQAWGYHWSVLYICPGFSPPPPRHLPLAWGYHWSVLSIYPGFSPPDTYSWPGDITGQFFLSALDFLPQTPTPGLGISLFSSLYLSWIFSPRHLPLAWGYHWSVLYICPGFSPPRHLPLAWRYHWSVLSIYPGFSPPDTYSWPGDITGQFFISVLDFLPQTPTPGLGISLVSSFYLSWIFSPRHLPLAWGYHWSVLYICPGFSPPRHLPLAWGYHWSVLSIYPGFSPPDTYSWPGDITGQFFISVLDFLPQTPTPGLRISLVSSLLLSWIFSPRHLPLAWGYHWSVLSIYPGFSPPDTYSWPGDITGQFFISVLDFLPQTPTPGLEISLISSLYLSWIFSPQTPTPGLGISLVSSLYICPGFSPLDTYPWPGDITGQFFISVLDFLPQTPTLYPWPGDINGQCYISVLDFLPPPPPRHLPLAWGYHWSVLSICPGFSPPDTYPWPGDITGHCYISVLDFLPQTPTPGLGISLVSALYYLSWIFSPRHTSTPGLGISLVSSLFLPWIFSPL